MFLEHLRSTKFLVPAAHGKYYNKRGGFVLSSIQTPSTSITHQCRTLSFSHNTSNSCLHLSLAGFYLPRAMSSEPALSLILLRHKESGSSITFPTILILLSQRNFLHQSEKQPLTLSYIPELPSQIHRSIYKDQRFLVRNQVPFFPTLLKLWASSSKNRYIFSPLSFFLANGSCFSSNPGLSETLQKRE